MNAFCVSVLWCCFLEHFRFDPCLWHYMRKCTAHVRYTASVKFPCVEKKECHCVICVNLKISQSFLWYYGSPLWELFWLWMPVVSENFKFDSCLWHYIRKCAAHVHYATTIKFPCMEKRVPLLKISRSFLWYYGSPLWELIWLWMPVVFEIFQFNLRLWHYMRKCTARVRYATTVKFPCVARRVLLCHLCNRKTCLVW